MSLDELLKELLLNHILVFEDITVFDLQSMMFSCRTLYRLIRHSNQLWRLKFVPRWPNIPVQYQERNESIWYEQVTCAIKAVKEVNVTLQEMSFLCYPLNQSSLNLVDKLIMGQHPIPECVQDELEQMAGYTNKNLTTQHYARDVLTKRKCRIIEHKLQDFIAQPESQKSLVEASALISQWFKMGSLKQTSLSDVQRAIEEIAEEVRKRAKNTIQIEIVNVENSFRTDDADAMGKAKKILDLIHHVMFLDMGYKSIHSYRLSLDHSYSIAEVLETKRGCRLLVNIIFQKVAKELGVRLQIVTYGERFISGEKNVLLRWSQNPGEVDSDRIYYIDVCAEMYSSFKPSHFYPAAMGQPASSAQKVLQEMMSTILKQLRSHLGSFRNFTGKGRDNDIRLFIRLAIIISPRETNLVLEYANLCLTLSVQLEDAIPLLYSAGLQGHHMAKQCANKLWKQRLLISAAKIPCYRQPIVKYAVGLVMGYKSMPDIVFTPSEPCVIVSWTVNFKKSDHWKTVNRMKPKGNKKQDQAHYHILVKHAPSGFIGLNVAQEKLELHPDVVLAHAQLGSDFGGNGYFERFDGRRYVPNAELRARFPDDEKVALALIA